MRKFVFLTLLFLLLCSTILYFLALASAQTSEETNDAPVTVRLAVYIHDIDEKKSLADVSINAFIDNYPDNETEIELQLRGGEYVNFKCTGGEQKTNGWSYGGGSNETVWLLEGRGERFPFDTYNLRFTIFYVGRINGTNCTFAEKDERGFLTTHYLNDLWKTQDGLLPVGILKDQEINFVLQRADSTVTVAFLEFFVPPIACYYLFGSALILDPKNLAERLRIYLSIFFFVPAFLIAVQAFFPHRVSLSFPELLLVNLLVSTSILGVMSTIARNEITKYPRKKRSPASYILERKWDMIGITLALSILMIVYSSTLISEMTPQLGILFSYLVIPAYIFWIPFASSKKKLGISRKLIYSLSLGIGISICACLIASLIPDLREFLYVIEIGAVLSGLAVGSYVRNTTRGAVIASISGIIGSLLAGVIWGVTSTGVGAITGMAIFGAYGSFLGIFALGGGLIAGLFWSARKNRVKSA